MLSRISIERINYLLPWYLMTNKCNFSWIVRLRLHSVPLLDNAEVTLIMYNKTEEKPLGKKRVRVVNPKNGKKYSMEFEVVKGNCKLLLGLRASEQINLISVINENILSVQTQASLQDKARHLPTLTKEYVLKVFADVFNGDGKLEGDLHLEIDPTIPPEYNFPQERCQSQSKTSLEKS